MNKKQLLIAAIATVLSITAASATSTISGITNGGSGNFDINPEKINGNVGYRQYDTFNLGSGDIANLIYSGIKNGETRDLSTFINLVNSQAKIDGILNAVKADGSGHAVFITPGGLTVGSSGVLNVGTLSVLTPTQTKYNSLITDYGNNDFTNINKINHMRNNTSASNPNNYGGNAPVSIDGYVFTRNGADIRGSEVSVAGGIVNGYKPANGFSANNFDGKSSAEALFNSLVNTSGIPTQAATFSNNGSNIVIKSGAGTGNNIAVTGRIANLDNGLTVLTNHGNAGINTSQGKVYGAGDVNIYNNNATGAMNIQNGTSIVSKNDLSVSSLGGMALETGSSFNAGKNLEVANNGNKMTLNGTLNAGDRVDVVNRGAQGAAIGATIGQTSSKPNTVRIVNENGKLTFSGTANANDTVSIRNLYDSSAGLNGNAMEVNGTINAANGALIHNQRGDLTLGGNINVTTGKAISSDGNEVALAVFNEGNGRLMATRDNNINVAKGDIAIKNTATNGMSLNGTITNTNGDIAINNGKTGSTNAGDMLVGGTITNTKGNMGIHQYGNGMMDVNSVINNTGKLKIQNVNGDGMLVDNKITNKNGNVNITNRKGTFSVDGEVTNSNGFLYVYSRDNSEGLTTDANSKIAVTNGNLAIKHNGSGTNASDNGLDLNGTITHAGTGQLAVNNYKGNTYVGGNVTTNAQSGIIARNGSDDLTVDAKVVSTNNQTFNIKNEKNTGDMTVKGDITHNGRLNILNNSGTLTLDGKITNNGSNRTYAIVRDPNGGNTQRDGGVVVGQNFNAQSTDGMIYVLNKVGSDGFTYKGTAKATNAQAELYNMAGDMTVNGGSFEGKPTIILNKGDKLTVTNAASITGDEVKIVNKGTSKSIGTNYDKKGTYYEQLKQ